MLPAYDLRNATRSDVVAMFERYHGYKSLGISTTYCFAVYEDDRPVAAFVWQPPPPGAAKATCPEAPQGVLALSRMVAVPRTERVLQHISKPLRRQMRMLIDRTRWPVLITYSDEGQGHTGHVYKCSGWMPTVRSKRPVWETRGGARASSYSDGKHGRRDLIRAGFTWVQRWEHRICAPGQAAAWMRDHGWYRIALEGKTWSNGKPAYTWVQAPVLE